MMYDCIGSTLWSRRGSTLYTQELVERMCNNKKPQLIDGMDFKEHMEKFNQCCAKNDTVGRMAHLNAIRRLSAMSR